MQSLHSNQLLADSAPNAIGAVVEYKALNCNDHSSYIEFDLSLANQNQWSAGYTSGTLKFALNPNSDLGAVLSKNHEIQVNDVILGLRLFMNVLSMSFCCCFVCFLSVTINRLK